MNNFQLKAIKTNLREDGLKEIHIIKSPYTNHQSNHRTDLMLECVYKEIEYMVYCLNEDYYKKEGYTDLEWIKTNIEVQKAQIEKRIYSKDEKDVITFILSQIKYLYLKKENKLIDQCIYNNIIDQVEKMVEQAEGVNKDPKQIYQEVIEEIKEEHKINGSI